MAKPYLKSGTWYARVKDEAGRWGAVALPEAKTRKRAEELATDLAYKRRRQRDGLDPLAPEKSLTVEKLLRWWLDTYVASTTWAAKEEQRFRRYFEGSDFGALPVAMLTAGRLEMFLQGWTLEKVAPASVNKLRAMVRTAWNRARKAGKLHGANPCSDVALRKVPKRAPAFLEPHEVQAVLAELQPTDRRIIATALYAGLRKGELFGLLRRDVDLGRRILMVRRSYEGDTTKGAREEAVPIAGALVPHLEEAIAATEGELLFPREDGSMRTEQDNLGDRLRSAMGRAGLVRGYVHSCRRCKASGKASPHVEEHPDNERRRCPDCDMVLWAKAIPRPFRLHDTRHTTATLLLTAGVDLYAVARILRHSDPKVTFDTYAHLVPGYLHEQIDRLGTLAPSPDDDPTKRDRAARECAKGSGGSNSVGSVGLSGGVGSRATTQLQEAMPSVALGSNRVANGGGLAGIHGTNGDTGNVLTEHGNTKRDKTGGSGIVVGANSEAEGHWFESSIARHFFPSKERPI